jgi:hypothetical protein
MSGISNLNIVVQQGGNTQETHQVKQQSVEHTQTVAAQEQAARAVEAKARVPDTDESEKPHLKRDRSGNGKGDHSPGDQKQGKKKEKKESASTGKLLNTVV